MDKGQNVFVQMFGKYEMSKCLVVEDNPKEKDVTVIALKDIGTNSIFKRLREEVFVEEKEGCAFLLKDCQKRIAELKGVEEILMKTAVFEK